MSQSDMLARAKQGDSRAISMLLSHYVQTEGVTVRVTQRDDCLYILLEAAQTPDLQAMVSVMERQIASLRLATVSTLMIFGRKSGEKKAIWQRVIDLDALASREPIVEAAPTSDTAPIPETKPLTEPLTEPLTVAEVIAEEVLPSAPEPVLEPVLEPAPKMEGSLTDLAAELISSARSTPVVSELSLEPSTEDLSGSGCVAIPTPDMPELESTPETTLASLTGDLLEPELQPDSTPATIAQAEIAQPNSLQEITSLLEFGATPTASVESKFEATINPEPLLNPDLETDINSDLDVDLHTEVTPSVMRPTAFSPEPDLTPATEPAVHSSPDPKSMITSDTTSVPDPWDADGQSSGSARATSGVRPAPSASSSAAGATASTTDHQAIDRDATDPAKPQNSSLQDVADALRGVTTVDTQSLLQRPEAIVLLAWLSMLVVWQLYLALASDDEIPGDQPLSSRKLAKRLGVHTRTLSRRRYRSDFSTWSQDLDPEGIAWVHQVDGGYAPLVTTPRSMS